MKVRLYFEKSGEGAACYLFLHGLLGNLDNWRTIARSLRIKGKIYLIDLRNHGRSPHASTHRYSDMAQDLLQFMEEERIPQVHVLGHSMGGKLGMYMALHYPRRIASLIVGDIASRAYSGNHQALIRTLLSVNLEVERREEVERQLVLDIPEPSVRQFLLKNLARNPEGKFFWRPNLPVLHREYAHILAAIEGPPYEGPVLFLKGERSEYILPSDERDIRRLFPLAQVRVIPRAGHWIHVDNPEAVRSLIESFWGQEG